MEQKKKCKTCDKNKLLENFYKSKSGKGGFNAECKSCVSLKREKYYIDNKSKCRENNKKYISINKEKVKLKWKEHWELNKEKHKQQYQENKEFWKKENKKYYDKNKDYWKSKNPDVLLRRKEYSEQYRKDNPIKYKEYHDKYKEKNRDKINKHNRTKKKERYKNDLDFKLKVNLRVMVYSLYKSLKQKKTGKTFNLLGYSVEQFKSRLEYQFNEMMNWDNYGTYWEIDHIKPINRFIEQGETRPHIINALSNLRPLSVSENRSKSDTFNIIKKYD